MTPGFKDKVVQIVRQIPRGKVASYGQIAALAGSPRGAITVGTILHHTKIELPWQRVINSKGFISTTCFEHPAQMQAKLLEGEGIEVSWTTVMPSLDLARYQWQPKTID